MAHHKLSDAAIVLSLETTFLVNAYLDAHTRDPIIARLADLIIKISMVYQFDIEMKPYRPNTTLLRSLLGLTTRQALIPELITGIVMLSNAVKTTKYDMLPIVYALKKYTECDINNPEFGKAVDVLADALQNYNRRRISLV